MRKSIVVIATALLGFIAAPLQAAESATEVHTGFYIKKSFGGGNTETTPLNYGLRFNYVNPTRSYWRGQNAFNQPAFIDLRFANSAFDSVYMNGLDIIETHRAVKAVGGSISSTLLAVGTAVAATAAVVVAGEASDDPVATSPEEPEEPGGGGDEGGDGGDDPTLGCDPILNQCL